MINRIRIYAKSRVDLVSNMGAYAFVADDFITQRCESKPFSKSIKTLAHADCAAYVNTLYTLSKTLAGEEMETLDIITDSGTVIELLDTYKFQKHCEEIMMFWRDKVRPSFVNLKTINFKKIGRKPLAGDKHTFCMQKCEVAATQALDKLRDITR